MIKLLKKIWDSFLNFVSWLTQDDARLRKAKKLPPEEEAMFRIRFPW